MISTRAAVLAISLTAVASVAACSSSGGGGVSQSQLEAKLKKEPAVVKLTQSGGASKAAVNKLISCEATELEKDAKGSDLQKYVDGSITIKQVKPKSSSAKSDAKTAITACAQSVENSGG